MAITDQRYRNINAFVAIALCWAEAVARHYGLGRVDRDSLQPLPTSSSSRKYQDRIGDSAWTFDTETRSGLLLLTEVQSGADFMAPVRFCQYICNQLLLAHQAQRFGPRRPLPLTVMISLYTGDAVWELPNFTDLFAPYAQGFYTVEMPIWHFDMKHMEVEDIPVRDPARLLFDVERYRGVADIDASALAQRLESLQDGDLKDMLLLFTRLVLQDFDPRLLPRVPLTVQELEEMIQAYRITHEEEVRRATERTRLEDCLEVLLACDIVPATALELGLDLLVMETRPALGLLIHARGDLDRLRAHIPPRSLDSVTAADRQYIEDLLQECHSYPHADYSGRG